ncbi:hypothetical protein [Pantoea ananatis]|uniref:hypothetical protein n=1 Tax=Pantoea ananas TaxID=553 RepID=UPI0011B0CC8B|nr:hypothetical protein [Pantoea ananatis]
MTSSHTADSKQNRRLSRFIISLLFGFFLFIASLFAEKVFTPVNAPVWAAGILFVSYVIRLCAPDSKKTLVKVLSMIGDVVAVVFVFLSLHDIFKEPSLHTPIVAASFVICLLAGWILYRDL